MKKRFVIGCWLLFGLIGCRALAQSAETEGGASVLVYNLYTSNSTMPFSEDTRLALTNASDSASVAVHLFFVAKDCKVADQFVALTASQTLTMLASDVDPGVRGYVIAVAINARTGCPINFNYLIGEAGIRLMSGHRAVLAAEGIQALRDNPTDCSDTAAAAELKFDGVRYGVLPRVLAADSFTSIYDGNQSWLIINCVSGDLREGAATTGTLFGLLYDDAESAYSFSLTGGCQVAGNIFGSTFPRHNFLPQAVPQGRTGWAKFYNNVRPAPLLGAVLNLNMSEREMPHAFNGGHNMHHLTSTDTGTLTIPVSPPNG